MMLLYYVKIYWLRDIFRTFACSDLQNCKCHYIESHGDICDSLHWFFVCRNFTCPRICQRLRTEIRRTQCLTSSPPLLSVLPPNPINSIFNRPGFIFCCIKLVTCNLLIMFPKGLSSLWIKCKLFL